MDGLLRLMSGVMAVGGGVLFILRLDPGGHGPLEYPQIAQALAYLLGGVGSAAVLWKLSLKPPAFQNRPGSVPVKVESIGRLERQVSDLHEQLESIRDLVERSHTDDRSPDDQADRFSQLTARLDQIAELAAMTDAQKQARFNRELAMLRRQHRSSFRAAVDAEDLRGASAALSALEALDDPADDLRPAFDSLLAQEQRRRLQSDAQQIEELMAASRWESALRLASQLVVDFPDSTEAAALAGRVRREHELFNESNVRRLFEQVKRASEQRSWREALDAAERLVEQAPDHPRTRKVLIMLATIRENAQIEQRQAVEAEIQRMIHDRRFDRAIELAEQLIEQHPDSPQAGSLREMMPRLRQMALG